MDEIDEVQKSPQWGVLKYAAARAFWNEFISPFLPLSSQKLSVSSLSFSDSLRLPRKWPMLWHRSPIDSGTIPIQLFQSTSIIEICLSQNPFYCFDRVLIGIILIIFYCLVSIKFIKWLFRCFKFYYISHFISQYSVSIRPQMAIMF